MSTRDQIQQRLNEAAKESNRAYWDFLGRKGRTVKLDPGVHYIDARDNGGPSLVVPRGVTFDFSDATLVMRPPKTESQSWCGILAHSSASMRFGWVVQDGKNPHPGGHYDGVRLWGGDNYNRHSAVSAGGVANFNAGAGIRLVGQYVTWIDGLLVQFCRDGIIHQSLKASKLNKLSSEYSIPGSGEAGMETRRPTDLWVQNTVIDSCSNSGITADGGNLMLDHVLIEGVPGVAVSATELSKLSMRDVHLEEVGQGGPMVHVGHCWGTVSVSGSRINVTGERRLSGDRRATPTSVYKVDRARSLTFEEPDYIYSQVEGLQYLDASGDRVKIVGGVSPCVDWVGSKVSV